MPEFKHLLIIGTVWPEPASSAAGLRMMQLIRLFLNSGWNITFASTSAESQYAASLNIPGVDTARIELNHSSFDRFVNKLQPSAVLFDRFMTEEQFGWRVAEQCPDAIRILDTEDLHSLRKARQSAFKKGQSFCEKDLLSEPVARREIAAIFRCDLSLIISSYEIQLLRRLFEVPEELLCYLPFLFDEEDGNDKWPGFHERRGYVTIGNFLHPPNWNSVLWLKQDIWPEIRRLQPDAVLNVYGAYPSRKVFQLHNARECFMIHGRAEDALKVISRNRVLLAPLRFGAGLKGKLVDAMRTGTPSVTTPIGAEGIAEPDRWCGYIEEEGREFAEKSVELYQNQRVWSESVKTGKRILSDTFSAGRFASPFFQTIQRIRDDLNQHRAKNFTGQMLMDQRTNAVKYLSRWIEEKNKTDAPA